MATMLNRIKRGIPTLNIIFVKILNERVPKIKKDMVKRFVSVTNLPPDGTVANILENEANNKINEKKVIEVLSLVYDFVKKTKINEVLTYQINPSLLAETYQFLEALEVDIPLA